MVMDMENIRMLNALKICVFVVARKKVFAYDAGGDLTGLRIEYLRKLINNGLLS